MINPSVLCILSKRNPVPVLQELTVTMPTQPTHIGRCALYRDCQGLTLRLLLLLLLLPQGLYYIAQGHTDRAKELFQEIIKEQPYNDVIPKQLVSSYVLC